MNADEIAELRRLHERGTMASWVVVKWGEGVYAIQREGEESNVCVAHTDTCGEVGFAYYDMADLALACAARNALPKLLDRIEELEAEKRERTPEEATLALMHATNRAAQATIEELRAKLKQLEQALLFQQAGGEQ